jgi:hypothetical protein
MQIDPVITAAILVLLLVVVTHTTRETFEVASLVDQRVYPVLGGFSDMVQAADRLAKINAKNQRLIRFMLDKYSQPGTHGHTLAVRMRDRYRGDRLVENDPPDKNNTSFTEDKGEKLALCLREKVTGRDNLHDHSILEFVDLHEMAHIASEGFGHDDEFWSNFAFLLNEAKLAGVHRPVDYRKFPVNYCGLDVAYNPYYDALLS